MPREVPRYIGQLGISSLPKVDFASSGDATRAVSEELSGMADVMQKKAQEIEKLKASATLKTELSRMYKESPNDPALLKSKIDGNKSGFIKGIESPYLAEQYSIIHDEIALTYIDKATSNYNQVLDNEKRVASRLNAEALMESIKDVIPNLYSETPEVKDAALASLYGDESKGSTGLFGEISEMAAMIGADGKPLFDDAESAAYITRAQKLIKSETKKARLAPIEDMLINDPTRLIQNIESGAMDKHFADSDEMTKEQEKDKYLGDAVKRKEDLDKRGFYLSGLNMLSKNQEMLDAMKNKDPNLMQMVEDGLDAGTLDPRAAQYVRDRFIKANPITPEDQTNTTRELRNRVNELKGDFKKGEATYETAAQLMLDIQRNIARGVQDLAHFQNAISEITLDRANNERGRDDLDDVWYWPDPTEEYDAAYEVVDRYLSSIGMEENAAARDRLLSSFIRRMDTTKETDPEKAMNEAIKAVINRDIARRTGFSDSLKGVPNAELKEGGEIVPVSPDKATMKADDKITDEKIILRTFPDGSKAHIHIRDGKEVQADFLNKDGTIRKTVFNNGGN